MQLVNFTPLPGILLKTVIETNSGLTDIEVLDVHLQSEEKIIEAVSEADILLGDYTFNTLITKNVVKAARKARLIQQPSAGYNNIDLAACRETGLKVANIPGANDVAVAEHTIMLALALLKKVMVLNREAQAANWLRKDGLLTIAIPELSGKTYGLIGLGRTGKAVADRLVPFGVRLLYHDIKRLSAEEENRYPMTYADLVEILQAADIISLHLPLTPQTENLFGKAELDQMKESAILINVGRGELVDEKALATALREKKIAGAGIDVFRAEPITGDNPLLGLDNVVLTPHVAGVTTESSGRIFSLTIANLVKVLKGGSADYLLD